MKRSFSYTRIELEGPPQDNELSVASAPMLLEQEGPYLSRELLEDREQLKDARELLCNACRALLRSGVPLCLVTQAFAGVQETLAHLKHHPSTLARFTAGREVEEWRLR